MYPEGKMKIILRLGVLFLCVMLSPVTASAGYKLSMLPRYSTEEIHKRIVPIADYLSKQTGLEIEPIVISTFDQYQQQLLSGAIQIGYENPYIYVLASKAHEVIALAEKERSGTRFRGIIITRSDSPIKTLEDLRGKTISIVGYTSAGGYLSQKLTLAEQGINVKTDCQLVEAADNKQENVILAVYTGDVDGGFIRGSALQRAKNFIPQTAIKVLKETAWLPNWALSVSRTMPPGDRKKIADAIFALNKESPAAQALKINRFIPATDQQYNSIRKAAGIALPMVNDFPTE